MRAKNQIKIGIGFVTGRKNFRNLIKTYVNNWHETGLVSNQDISLHLLVAYDLKYSQTNPSDYRNIDPEVSQMLDSVSFIDDTKTAAEKQELIRRGILDKTEAELLFGDGYGKKRNIVMYYALKNSIDYLIFIDDDEYPVAPVQTPEGTLHWKGQNIITSHLKYIGDADVTHGHHCGYISPIPHLTFDQIISENIFKTFIEAISNDILSWDSIRAKMENGGVSLADSELLANPQVHEVLEHNGAKFISGSNLCFNLKRPEKLAPFYNPPGARGEDTFLSTCLLQARVLKVPCYTFHDGFLNYTHLLHGVLPHSLRPIQVDNSPESHHIVNRFLKACIGWVRYKPLLLYLQNREDYPAAIAQIQKKLTMVIPRFCQYFHNNDFALIPEQLDRYHRNVAEHFTMFEETKTAWSKVVAALPGIRETTYPEKGLSALR